MVRKALVKHSKSDCSQLIIRAPKVNGVITCPVCLEPFKNRLYILEHFMTHRVKELKEKGFKKSMVKQQASELLGKDKSRKLKSNERSKKWYAQKGN